MTKKPIAPAISRTKKFEIRTWVLIVSIKILLVSEIPILLLLGGIFLLVLVVFESNKKQQEEKEEEEEKLANFENSITTSTG